MSKDLLIVVTGVLQDGVSQLVLCGTICLGYTLLLGIVLPYKDQSANNIDIFSSLLLSMQTFLSAGAGFADATLEDSAEYMLCETPA